MSNANQKRNENEHTMGILQDKLDLAVFEQEEVDPKQVKAILEEMERISPLEENEQEKESMWERIKEECREEFEADEKALNSVSNRKHRRNSARIRKFVLMAATLVLAVFIGANIGTYATEKKNVFEYVGDLKNGTAFRVSGDAPSMEMEETTEVYYSWNDVPNEYRDMLIIPQGIPEELQLYCIKINNEGTVEWFVITYVDNDAKKSLNFYITRNDNKEFSFVNLLYNEEFSKTVTDEIFGICVDYYINEEEDIIAQFTNKMTSYLLSGNLEFENIQMIVEETIKKNF